MRGPETLQFTTPTEREIVMTRAFAAPRRLVFEAFTKPELLKRWLFGPDGWALAASADRLWRSVRETVASMERRGSDHPCAGPASNQLRVCVEGPCAHAAARSRSSRRSRALAVSDAARSNSVRASSKRPSRARRSPRTLGSRW